ncbi:hypothetical protein SAMN05428944_0295 [Streptomyces sp. 1222.5]|nr:hypothetical protein BX260_7800 [Streptomyces sp. 5112.2]SEB56316.1 hypothetical protein SAMN05428944_0295 [Streptomyces sp. 1222.5]
MSYEPRTSSRPRRRNRHAGAADVVDVGRCLQRQRRHVVWQAQDGTVHAQASQETGQSLLRRGPAGRHPGESGVYDRGTHRQSPRPTPRRSSSSRTSPVDPSTPAESDDGGEAGLWPSPRGHRVTRHRARRMYAIGTLNVWFRRPPRRGAYARLLRQLTQLYPAAEHRNTAPPTARKAPPAPPRPEPDAAAPAASDQRCPGRRRPHAARPRRRRPRRTLPAAGGAYAHGPLLVLERGRRPERRRLRRRRRWRRR